MYPVLKGTWKTGYTETFLHLCKTMQCAITNWYIYITYVYNIAYFYLYPSINSYTPVYNMVCAQPHSYKGIMRLKYIVG